MSNTRLFLAAALACLLSGGTAHAAEPAGDVAAEAVAEEAAQAEPQVLLDAIRSNRKALIEINLALSPEESAKFWPLYDRYQTEISAIGDRVLAIVEEYSANFRTLSNDKALELMGRYLAAEGERNQVRRTYLPEFAKILPGRTVARFYQIENKMDAVMRYDLAATIPVVDEKSDAPGK